MANVSDPALNTAYQEVRNDKTGKTWYARFLSPNRRWTAA
jgi:hypothetical protein